MKKNEQILFPKDCPKECPYLRCWDLSIDDWTSVCDKLKIQIDDCDMDFNSVECPLKGKEVAEAFMPREAIYSLKDMIKLGYFNEESIGDISDGFHTYNELYYQRVVLFATIVNLKPEYAWKSFRHSDGRYCFDSNGEWFIVGITTPEGNYTYHYEKKYWNLFDCMIEECAPEWDGHTDKDVKRLLSLAEDNTTRWITDHNDGATRICERCGYCEPYKNAGIETEIFDYCPFCGRRAISKRS